MEKVPPELSYAIVSYLDRADLLALHQTSRVLTSWAAPHLFSVHRLKDNDDRSRRQCRSGPIRKVGYENMVEVVNTLLPIAPFISKLEVAPMYYMPGIWELYRYEREKFVDAYVDQNEYEDLSYDMHEEISDQELSEQELEDLDERIMELGTAQVVAARRIDFNGEMLRVDVARKKWNEAIKTQDDCREDAKGAILKLVECMHALTSLEISSKVFNGYEGVGWECQDQLEMVPELSTTTIFLNAFANGLKSAHRNLRELIWRDIFSEYVTASDDLLHTFRNLEKLQIQFLSTKKFLIDQRRSDDFAKLIGMSRPTLEDLTIHCHRNNVYLPPAEPGLHCLQDLLGESPQDSLTPLAFPLLLSFTLTTIIISSDFLIAFLKAQPALQLAKFEHVTLANDYGNWHDVARNMPKSLDLWYVDTCKQRQDVDFGDVIERNRLWTWTPSYGKVFLQGWRNELNQNMTGYSITRGILRRNKV